MLFFARVHVFNINSHYWDVPWLDINLCAIGFANTHANTVAHKDASADNHDKHAIIQAVIPYNRVFIILKEIHRDRNSVEALSKKDYANVREKGAHLFRRIIDLIYVFLSVYWTIIFNYRKMIGF